MLCLRVINFLQKGKNLSKNLRYYAVQCDKISFNDHKEAFKSKTTSEILRAYTILSMCANDKIVDNTQKLLYNGEKWLGNRIFYKIMKKTIYEQFVAGETGPVVKEMIKNLQNQGLQIMIANALESDIDENHNDETSDNFQDRNLKELLEIVNLSGEACRLYKNVTPSVQLKLTALIPTNILVDFSKIITRSHSNKPEYFQLIKELSSMLDVTKGINREKIKNMFEITDDKEINVVYHIMRRLSTLGNLSKEKNIKIWVDMEWTYVNPACSAFTSAMMIAFNKLSPIICSTIQCYLKGALETLKREEDVAKEFNVCYGAKIVRGAYLEKEKQVAPMLLCQSYEETSQNYRTVSEYAMDKANIWGQDRYYLLIATHNENAVLNTISYLRNKNIENNKNIGFGQIYGMAEHISLPLAQAGFIVYKSVAFGTVRKVLPYLARRAAENKSVMIGARRERKLLKKELKHRLKLSF